jgi:hypothetical protein
MVDGKEEEERERRGRERLGEERERGERGDTLPGYAPSDLLLLPRPCLLKVPPPPDNTNII